MYHGRVFIIGYVVMAVVRSAERTREATSASVDRLSLGLSFVGLVESPLLGVSA